MKTGIWVLGIMIALGLGFKFFQMNTVRVQKPPVINATSTEPMSIYENKELGIYFPIPKKYSSNIEVGSILIIPNSSNSDAVIIENTILDGSGLNPKATDIKKEFLGGREVSYVRISRFEGLLQYRFFIKKSNFLFPIDVKWNTGLWSDASYVPEKDIIFTDAKKIISNIKFTDTDPGIYEGVINNP